MRNQGPVESSFQAKQTEQPEITRANNPQPEAEQADIPLNNPNTPDLNEPPTDAFVTVRMSPIQGDGSSQQSATPTHRAAQTDPVGQAQIWLSRAATSTTFEERLVYLSQAVSLAPGQTATRYRMYETLKPFLERRPFLRYAHENALLYRVSTAEGLALTVAKDRAIAPVYPPPKPTPLRPVFRWFGLSLLGLLVAGLGTLVCAPIAAQKAWAVSHHATDPSYRQRARALFLYAVILWLIALVLSGLFLAHLYGYG